MISNFNTIMLSCWVAGSIDMKEITDSLALTVYVEKQGRGIAKQRQ